MKKIILLSCLFFILTSCSWYKSDNSDLSYEKSTTHIDINTIEYNNNWALTYKVSEKDTLKAYKIVNWEKQELDSKDYAKQKSYYWIDNQWKYYINNNIKKDWEKEVTNYVISKDSKHFAFNVFDINVWNWILVKDWAIVNNNFYKKFDFDKDWNMIYLQKIEWYKELTLVENWKAIVEQDSISDFTFSDDKKHLAFIYSKINANFNDKTKDIESPFIYYISIDWKISKQFNNLISNIIFSPNWKKVTILETETISSSYNNNKYSVTEISYLN